MKIILAKSAGFCFGVKRAVSIAEKSAEEGGRVFTLGPIIHNKHVIEDLAGKGVKKAGEVSEIPEGSTVIIRSHGAGQDEYDRLRERGTIIVDATCPDVAKIHDIVGEASRCGRIPVIIGKKNHPEVLAICGRCENPLVFEDSDEFRDWLSESPNNPNVPITVVYQTTETHRNLRICNEIIKKECTNYKIFDTICNATSKRQEEADNLSVLCDAMIVIGDKDSANSLRLAEICRQNCDKVFFIESADEIDRGCLSGADTVGITAGASAPARIIKEVYEKVDTEIKETPELKNIEEEQSAAEAAPAEAVSPVETSAAEIIAPESADAVPEDAAEDSAVADVAADVDGNADDAGIEYAPAEDTANEDVAVIDADDGENNETFEEMLEKSIKTLHTGEKVRGIVASVSPTEISVDLGIKQSGYIPLSELTDDPSVNVSDLVKVGDEIETYVMRVNDVEGTVMLSKKRLDSVKSWDDIEAALVDKTIVEGVVTEENKGGVVASVRGVRVFIPASQTGIPKDSPMAGLIKTRVKMRITEVNRSRRRVIGSIRSVQAEERRERANQVWSDIETGKRYNGTIKSMTSYGVFVDIGGVDGMVHVSELSWARVKNPADVVSVGDELEVYVISFDKEKKRISLGYRKLEDNPWNKFISTYEVGSTATVKIVKFMPFGAFAEVIPGVDGLIHISQIANRRINKPDEVLALGQTVDVKITDIDHEKQKISLSIRALMDQSEAPITEKEVEAAEEEDGPVIVYDTDAPPAVDGVAEEFVEAEPAAETEADPVQDDTAAE